MNLIVFFFALFGLALGSFGNVILYRIARGQSIGGRSHCPHCRAIIHWFDLIPVVSFVLLGGRCRRCHAPISMGYPIIEVASGIAFVAAYYLYSENLIVAGLTGVLFWALLLTAVFDVKREQIPDLCTAIAAGVALLLTFLGARPLSDALLGAGVGLGWFGAMWGVSRGKGVGSGDIFLAAALGLWLGLQDTIVMLLMSYILGTVVIVLLLLFKIIPRVSHQHVPFAPFLALGALSAFLGVGDWYLQMIGF